MCRHRGTWATTGWVSKQQQQRTAPLQGNITPSIHRELHELLSKAGCVGPLSRCVHHSSIAQGAAVCPVCLPHSHRQAPAAWAQQHSRQELLALQAQERVRHTHQQVRSTPQAQHPVPSSTLSCSRQPQSQLQPGQDSPTPSPWDCLYPAAALPSTEHHQQQMCTALHCLQT